MTPLLVPLHGLGSRQDLPLPLPAVIGGAAVVLVVSFAVLALAWRESRWDGVAGGRPLAGLTRLVDARWFRGASLCRRLNFMCSLSRFLYHFKSLLGQRKRVLCF